MAVINQNIMVEVTVQTVVSALGTNAAGVVIPVQTIVLGATIPGHESGAVWPGPGEVSVELTGIAMTGFQPGQRVRVTLSAVDPWMC